MSHPNAADVPEQWDSYLATIDEKPGSILVNLWMAEHAPLEDVDTLHQWALQMRDPGPHGMGTPEEAQGFDALEDEITKELRAAGFYSVGRMRHAEHWQVSYYAKGDREAEFKKILGGQLGPIVEHVQIGVVGDPDWDYFFGMICPDRQQVQWMSDRDLVMQLQEQGDTLVPRVVEHFCYFKQEAEARAFSAEADERGFAARIAEAEPEEGAEPVELPWMVEVTKTTSVELHEVHVVVMQLVELAEACGGQYDGWGTELVKA